MNALSSGRPKRNLHIYVMLAVGALFLGLAAYKGLTRSSDSRGRVAERPGAKAVAQEPSPLTLRELIAKQSKGEPAVKAEPPREGSSAIPLPAERLPTAGSPALPPQLDLMNTPRAIALPVEASAGLDRKLSEASYMTAKTDVYVQPVAASGGSAVDPGAEVVAASTRTAAIPGSERVGAADSLARLLDSRELGKLMPTNKTAPEERIAARVHEQAAFAGSNTRAIREPARVVSAPSLFVAEGTMIPAVIVRSLDSQLPGQVEARVVSDVYDSLGRGRILIPKGSRMTGTYNANVGMGQERLQVVFTRLMFPSGNSIALDSASGYDGLGQAGVNGDVDRHYVRMLGSALAIGMLTYAVERRAARDAAAQVGAGAVNVYGGSASGAGTVAAQTFANVTNQMLDRHLSIGPTITVPAGTRFYVQTARDLAIDPEKGL